MVDARHAAIGYPKPKYCTCEAPEYAEEMEPGVTDYVIEWLKRHRFPELARIWAYDHRLEDGR